MIAVGTKQWAGVALMRSAIGIYQNIPKLHRSLYGDIGGSPIVYFDLDDIHELLFLLKSKDFANRPLDQKKIKKKK